MRKAHDELPEDNAGMWEELKKRGDRIEALEAALRAVNHTLSVHGHVDAGTHLHEWLRIALAPEQDK